MFRGSIVALITPMHEDGRVDDASLGRLVEFHIENATSAIVAVGTTGESATLDEDEHCEVIRRVIELAAGRIPVIAGTGANATTEAVRLTRCAADAGLALEGRDILRCDPMPQLGPKCGVQPIDRLRPGRRLLHHFPVPCQTRAHRVIHIQRRAVAQREVACQIKARAQPHQ